MKDKGVRYIASSLLFNNTLGILDLGNNFIGNEGFNKLSESIKNNKGLIRLDLGQINSK